MKLVLYSGGDNTQNEAIDKRLVSMLPTNPKISYIPSNSNGYEPYLKMTKDYFNKYKIEKVFPFLADKAFNAKELEQLLKSDAIYLSGGNTYYFLHNLKIKQLLHPLVEYVGNGGVLIGVSAGAVLQTPNIGISAIPSFDAEDNVFKLTNLRAMNLVPFEFYPHYPNLPDYDTELLEYSKQTKNPILACNDGSGVVVDGDQITLYGTITQFNNGVKSNLTP